MAAAAALGGPGVALARAGAPRRRGDARSAMGAAAKALQVAALLGAGAAVGSALFALVTPGELRKQTMLKEMPEQDARLQDAASWRQRLVMDALRKAAATPENVAYKDRWVAGSPGRSE